jgi:hypothetical protein
MLENPPRVPLRPWGIRARRRVLLIERDKKPHQFAPNRSGSENLRKLGKIAQPVGVPRRPIRIITIDDPIHKMVRLARLVKKAGNTVKAVVHPPSLPERSDRLREIRTPRDGTRSTRTGPPTSWPAGRSNSLACPFQVRADRRSVRNCEEWHRRLSGSSGGACLGGMRVTYLFTTIVAAVANGYAASLNFVGAEPVKTVADRLQVSRRWMLPLGPSFLVNRPTRIAPRPLGDPRSRVACPASCRPKLLSEPLIHRAQALLCFRDEHRGRKGS